MSHRARLGAVRSRRAAPTPTPERFYGIVIRRLRTARPGWHPTAIEEVRATTPNDPFRILVACILSLRTRDETSGPAAQRLFAAAPDPRRLLALPESRIAALIYPVAFYRTKAAGLRRLCRVLLERFEGHVPAHLDQLLALPGVGRKTANLVRTVGFALPGICVDTHVHRITNRLGFVATRTPEQTEAALRASLPRRYWIGLNDLLVAFGQRICRPVSPRCSACPLADLCPRIGVLRHR